MSVLKILLQSKKSIFLEDKFKISSQMKAKVILMEMNNIRMKKKIKNKLKMNL